MALVDGDYEQAAMFLVQALEFACALDDRESIYYNLMSTCNVAPERAMAITWEYLQGKQQAGEALTLDEAGALII